MQYWVIPPEADAEFVAHREDVLETYSKPYDCDVPVLCMDEQLVQLIKDTKVPIAATKEHPRRVDYEYQYERPGVANVFMFTEPLSRCREVMIREKKTKVDWTITMANLIAAKSSWYETISTHTIGAFYEVFEPERARSLVRRIEFHYTPKHGCWLNITENALSSMTRQCVARRRIGNLTMLESETHASVCDVNETQRAVHWQMKIDDAWMKPTSVYPKIKL
ncbi:hypothetical protein CA13_38710 [Planctomycetes bacterium CA13]|uniref:Tc1-like transposase DDE domain-containing protein n=2 Tax=Novipirellula herctigrandis TaxID=2527986 RepID=A0A5C5Z510_9BACT|nr:hypothetical protein CA13_38710 [Planctomycetes bacterium CA13]